jgi:putative hydrolase of the HAD superfamily
MGEKIIKAVLFDVDNTLVDFMRMKNVAVEMAVEYMLNAGLPGDKQSLVKEIFNIYRRTHIESQRALDELIISKLGKLDYKILSAGIIGYQRGRDMSTYPYPKVEYVLKELLKIGLQLGTISDAPAEQCYNRLTRAHLINWMDLVITFDDTKEYKPSPKPFLLAVEKLKFLPEEVLYVGDWPERDIIGAKKAGLVTVFARWGEHPEARNTGADYELDSIEQVLDIVKKINKIT